MARNYSKRVSRRRSTYKAKKNVKKKKINKTRRKKSKRKRGGSNGVPVISSIPHDSLLGDNSKQVKYSQPHERIEKPVAEEKLDGNLTYTAAKTAKNVASKVSDKVSELGTLFNGFFQS